jgi:hypothetical protein
MKNKLYILISSLPIIFILINLILYFAVFTNDKIMFLSYISFNKIEIGFITLFYNFTIINLGLTSFLIIIISIISLLKKHLIFLLVNLLSVFYLFSYTMWFITLFESVYM